MQQQCDCDWCCLLWFLLVSLKMHRRTTARKEVPPIFGTSIPRSSRSLFDQNGFKQCKHQAARQSRLESRATLSFKASKQGYHRGTPDCAILGRGAIQHLASNRRPIEINRTFFGLVAAFARLCPGTHVDWGRKQDASLWLGGQRTATALWLG